ncbi:Hypothetical predicted protein [Cloeon dipterum]|uniref:Uncharacterized protein n=1 Tax=Cloeon dipterum TaxID=197152 RepID=A0A8S1DBK4_9INSE|nr:Hypothetical predicted protein [Cloeon dipterum]
MYACQQNRDGQVRELLAQNKSQLIKQRDRTMKSALHYCVENSTATSAELVLAAAPELLDARDKDGFTPLNLAIIAGNISLVRFLLHKRADLTAVDNEKHSLVHWATVCGEVEALEALLEAGADPCMPDIHNGYPIHYAAQMCGANSEMGNDAKVGIKMLSKLLARKVSVHVVDSDGRQPILWAASAGSADAVLSLINAGAAVEAADKDGLTALHCAASRGHTECLETLITLCGANVNVIDNHGCTALFYAVTLGHADCTQLLLNFGADYDTQDRRGRTSAHCGAAKGQLETLKLLHTAGADLWKRNVRGELPLHDAVQSGRRELVRWLLALRPDMVTAANSDGCSCLHIAAIRNYVEMCRVLLDGESFVNPVMRTSKGALMTPLDAALAKENRSCAKYLQLLGGVPASKLTEEAAALRGQRKAYLDHMDLMTPRLEASPSLLSGYSTPAMQQFNSLEVPQVSSKVSHDDDQISSQRSARKVRLRKSKSPRSSSSESDKDDRGKRVRRKSRRHGSKEKKERRVQSVDGAADAAVDAREENREEADTEHATRAKATRDRSSASKSKKQLIDTNQITTDDDEVASEASVLETREAERKEERKIAESNTDANEEQEKTKAASAKAKSARQRSQPQAKLEKSKSDKAESQKVDEVAGKPSTVQQKDESRGQLSPVGEASTSSEQSLTDGSEREKTAATAVADVKDNINETALEDVAPKKNQKKMDIIAGTNAKKQENGAKSKKAVSSEHEKATASKIIEIQKQDSDTSDSVGKAEGAPDAKSKKSETEVPLKTDDPKQKPSKKQETAKNSRAMSKERKESEVSKPRQTAIKEASRVAASKPPRAVLSEKGDRDGKSQEKAEGSDACSETNASSSDVSQTQADDGTSDSKSAPDKRADSNNRKQRKLKREANTSETPGTTEATAAASSDSQSDPTETEFQDTDSGVQEKTGKSSEQESEHSSESTADDKFAEEHSSSGSRAAKEEIPTGKGDKITEAPCARHKKPDDVIAIPSVAVVESGQQAKREGPRNKAAEKDEPAVIAVFAAEPKKTVAFEKQALEPPTEPTKHLINGKPSQRVPPLPKGLHQPIDRSAQIEEDEKKAREIIRRRHEQSVVSVTQAVQVSTRKYQLERRIFQELLELKKMQLRAGRGNESVIVKRAVDEYRKAGLIVGLRQYDGPYSFRAFEQYLYDQLKLLQNSSDARIIARLKPTDDVSSLAAALRLSVPRHSPAFCTVSTHRCHHAADAYTNVPVANYVARLPQTERFLPEIESPKKENGSLVSTATTKTLRHVDIRKPMTLELSLGGERQIIALPTEKLDKSKRYFVSFSIKPKHTSAETGREAPEDNKHQHATTI